MTSWNEVLLEVESYMERYRKALKDIADSSEQANPIKLKEIARTALDGEPTTADELNEVQNHGPPYSMANTSGEPVKDHSLGAGFAHKDTKKGIQDDTEC
tara:strand:+ start:257 stop:556 length:300 start_codon:yes stop_codon:yes gene_type:complete